MIKKFAFTQQLGWSISRFDIFSTCKRKYYYNYYSKFDQDFKHSEIDELKKLTTEALTIGSLVHDLIEKILHRLKVSNTEINLIKFEQVVEKLCTEYCKNKQFFEVYYKQKEAIDIVALKNKILELVYRFIKTERYEWIRNLPEDSKLKWIIEPDGYGETRINGMKAYCKVDFMLPVNNDVYILDWKTGKEDFTKHKKQLIGYSLFANYHFNKSFDKIIPILVYLKDSYQEVIANITPQEVLDFEETAKMESLEMKTLNEDVEKNTPLPKEVFKMINNDKICAWCEFKKLCNKS